MPIIAALDVGDATIGVAISDDLCIAAHPVKTLIRTKSVKADLRELEALLLSLDVECVVVGIPYLNDGNIGDQTKKTLEFYERLKRRMRIPVEQWDERYTTKDAEDMLLSQDISRKKRSKVIDTAAAVMILDSYIQNKNS